MHQLPACRIKPPNLACNCECSAEELMFNSTRNVQGVSVHQELDMQYAKVCRNSEPSAPTFILLLESCRRAAWWRRVLKRRLRTSDTMRSSLTACLFMSTSVGPAWRGCPFAGTPRAWFKISTSEPSIGTPTMMLPSSLSSSNLQ